MFSTDFLRLSEHKIFRETRENAPKNLSKTLNVLTVRESVLFLWDFVNNCVLTLNVKAARSRDGDNVQHQKLLPLTPPLFRPEFLVCNETVSLLAVCGANGILVFELPKRHPPYGAFDNNKEVVYCRTHSLDERLFSCSDQVDVRQAKFHPGSHGDNHLVVLSSDNMLRIYQVFNSEALNLATYSVGEMPVGVFPGSHTPFLECFGEIAVDFDFGHAEIEEHMNNYTQTEDHPQLQKPNKPEDLAKSLRWPVYILRGDGSVYSMDLSLNKKVRPFLQGPLPMANVEDFYDQNDACAIVCLNTNPQVVCVALANGMLCHFVLLDLDQASKEARRASAKTVTEVPSKELLVFETVELELGLLVSDEDLSEKKYKCPIFLHKDESKVNRYFATHNGGVHSLTLSCLDDLQEFVAGSDELPTDLFSKKTGAEYMVCTKTSTTELVNPVVGFSLYYEPTSLICLLADGSLVTLAIVTTVLPLKQDKLNNGTTTKVGVNSPLKTMLKEPFDCYIQNILKKASTQPIIKLAGGGTTTQEEKYELLQRVAQVFRDQYFKYHNQAHEELEKRIQALQMLKNDQTKVLKQLELEKTSLQSTAESLAEKYEDIKDKQDELLKRCEKLLMLVARRRQVPSNAEKDFLKQVNDANEKLMKYQNVIDKVKEKMKYQQIKIQNWKAQENKKILAINPMQENTIKTNLKDMTQKIDLMIRDVNSYKGQLNIK